MTDLGLMSVTAFSLLVGEDLKECVETRDGSRMTSKELDTWNSDNYNIK